MEKDRRWFPSTEEKFCLFKLAFGERTRIWPKQVPLISIKETSPHNLAYGESLFGYSVRRYRVKEYIQQW